MFVYVKVFEQCGVLVSTRCPQVGRPRQDIFLGHADRLGGRFRGVDVGLHGPIERIAQCRGFG